MKRFLRYNSRHGIYFPGDGALPQLNPISSRSHSTSGKRTHYFHEPLWLFRLRQRLFAFAGKHRCAERGGRPGFHVAEDETPDTWDIGPDGNRTCSFCGSIHFDDFEVICRKTLEDDRYGVESTTKRYKVYVRQPGVRNAGEGAIKFYTHHAPDNPTAEQNDLFRDAQRVTHERFMARWNPPKAEAGAS